MMKLKIVAFFISLAISTANNSFAQIPASGSNTTRAYLDKFEGTWIWSNGNSQVTLKLKKLNYYFTDFQYSEDVIVGSHKYINNGVLVEDYLPEFNTINQGSLSSIFLWAKIDGTITDEISGILEDQTKHKKVSIRLTFMAGAIPNLICQIRQKADVIITPMLPGITLPEDIILTRQ